MPALAAGAAAPGAVAGAAVGGPGAAAGRGGVVEAAGFSWPVVPEVPGVHCMLQAQGPLAPGGWCKSAAGTVAWKWSCRRCGITATNSTRLLAVLRTACGEAECHWEQRNHTPEVEELRVRCTRCDTTRQRHVQLGSQKCPVRVMTRQAADVPAGTAVYAAWLAVTKAMHRRSRPETEPGGDPVPLAAAEPAVAAAAGSGQLLQLRPFRAHAFVCAAGCEFCIRCFARAPRFRVSEWRAGCCDGDTPVGAAPKHLLAALHLHSQAGGQVGQAGTRLSFLQTAAKEWQRSLAGKSLRPPKRRGGPGHSPQADRARRSHGREQGNGR